LKGIGHNSTGANELLFYPNHYLTKLMFTAVFLFRMLVDQGLTAPTHRTRAIQGMIEARDIFRLIPPYRRTTSPANHLETMINWVRSLPEQPSPGLQSSIRLTVTNRLGASLLWDTLPMRDFIARSGHAAGGSWLQAPEGGASDTTMVEPLPYAPGTGSQMLDGSMPFLDRQLEQERVDPGVSWASLMNDVIFLDADQETLW
jgi:hypothetical protein